MIEITFQHKEDAKKLYNQLYKNFSALQQKDFLLSIEDSHIVKLTGPRPLRGEDLKLVKETFRNFILYEKRDDWFRNMISELFLFHDPEEQRQILEIIYSLLEGDREELFPFLVDIGVEENVTATIDGMFEDNISFSFDSFIKFRMRSFMANLEKYVEVAIDEYKMEQEYQMFIQTLRDFLSGRGAKLTELHLFIDEGVTFFDEYLNEIKRSVLTKMIDRKLLSNHPVYVDSITIAPLLSIAPHVIYVYTTDSEQPLVRTIQNIFEERVTIHSYEAFYQKKFYLSKVEENS
ncbi:putative sporulation protein YtxC [Bacillus aquiflavi]|uniref:Putative sporulation protein YtxC n=1 Tax=Bacillus aquiflavi TaxID=2672567 RepID=A0A6B3VWI1_9BACI|nr:putative sporulation protein YtxC [Bacillus aquiflavi]MBA4537085.1 putative sporulation protein YtxC [Bacillus aquiflavi]NEY81382.1 putative sporulation protein YtxC [Bacillus aquiflavi]UAC47519.1 putative sporulation protein YtxC [Bacillus aquiflavi]